MMSYTSHMEREGESEPMGGPQAIRIAAALRKARLRLGWTRETLAHHSGLSWAAITQIETGRRTDVRLSTLVALADALHVSLDYLALASGEPTRSDRPLLEHEVMPFSSEAELTEVAVERLARSEGNDVATLVIAPKTRLTTLRRALRELGPSAEYRDSAEWYTTPSETVTRLRGYCRTSQSAGATWTRVIGEPVWDLGSRSDTDAWTHYERMLNAIFSGWPVTIICAYDTQKVPARLITRVCRYHPSITAAGKISPNETYEHPDLFSD